MVAAAAGVVAVAALLDHPDDTAAVLAGVALAWLVGALVLAGRREVRAWLRWWASPPRPSPARPTAARWRWPPRPCSLVAILVASPDGRVPRRSLGALLGLAAVVGAGAAVVIRSRPQPATAALVVEWLVLAALGAVGYLARCRSASPVERARLQWLGWGLVVGVTLALASFGLEAIVGFPPRPALVAAGATVLVPVVLVAATFDAALRVIQHLLVRTIVVAGLVALVLATYLLVVIGLGHVPTSSDRQVLASSMVAAAVAALLTVPARHRLEEVANQRVYGERQAPDEPLRTFAGRMSRAVPLDELLLQLAESLHKSLALSSAEVWTGTDGVLDRVASVPSRGPARLALAGEELAVVARAHVSGNAWVQVWLPDLAEGRSGLLRVVSVSHLGQLLGLLLAERPVGATAFTDEDDRALAELARPLGLALHNVRLDSALQASLDELRRAEPRAARLAVAHRGRLRRLASPDRT